MSSGAGKVRAFVDQLPSDAIFARKQLVGEFGSRGVVDNVLKRLCTEEKIARVATGIYQKRRGATLLPTSSEIIELRASVFGKTIIGPVDTSINCATFLTDGCRSSFRSIHGRLYFKSVSRARAPRTIHRDHSSSVLEFPASTAARRESKVLSLLRRWFTRISSGWG